jgi:integrase
MRRVFDRVIERIGLSDHTPHDCRDTFATMHLTDDWNQLGWVSAQLGHEKVTTTENHYYKWRPTEASKQYANLVR